MSVKILTVVGARPQFIKAAMFSHAINESSVIDQVLVHTGQHFDYGMSQVFFEELSIPVPDVNLGISGGTHAEMTGKMMIALEHTMNEENPDCVLVFGDTNSTLAAALSAAKLCIPVVHAEAGFRTHFLTNPEEVNRVCTDHISSLLFAPIPCALKELKREGLEDKSVFTGDLMYDAYREYSVIARKKKIELVDLNGTRVKLPKQYSYLTCHRQENTSREILNEVLRAVEELEMPVVYPIHPRVSSFITDLQNIYSFKNTIFIQPVGYLESLLLLDGAEFVITDSGGLQREAFFAQKKCVTLLPFPSADETLIGNRNSLVSPVLSQSILDALMIPQEIDPVYQPFGDGHAAEKMVQEIQNFFGGKQ